MSIESVKGKWALITGASRGIGRQVALAMAKLGTNLVLHSRDATHTDAIAKECQALGVKTVQVAAELSDQSQVDSMLDAALKVAGPIDLVFNNAAIMTKYRQDPWTVTAEDFRLSFEVNVIALARICNRLVPPMLQRKWGRVVNTTSGIQEQPELIAYSISKGALDKYVRDFAPSLKGTGVMMNLLDPGWLRTDLGGPNAPNSVESSIPGAIIPALLDDGISGRFFRAQDYAGMSLAEALKKAMAAKA